jgi:hypothetical protein
MLYSEKDLEAAIEERKNQDLVAARHEKMALGEAEEIKVPRDNHPKRNNS